uniref:EGF-like domain-containing protein n=1 Tax=Strongyloides papillosus TaxID=174720 RepID=A0A0N5BHJ5_STREA
MLKLLWILAVYSIYICSCHGSDDYKKQFKYFYNDYNCSNYKFHESFPRKHNVKSNTEIIAIKCPTEHIEKEKCSNLKGYTYIIIYFKSSSDVKESLIFGSKEGRRYDWRIYDIKKNEKKKIINCIDVMRGDPRNSLTVKWEHSISRNSGSEIDIKRKEDFNIMSHTYQDSILRMNVKEKTFVFGAGLSYREFNSEHSRIYKGDVLFTFNANEINSEDVEFQEPIGITQVYHPPPFIDIQNDLTIKVNAKNKEWCLVEPHKFPFTLKIKLAFNGTTSQPNFFDYENITVSYLKYSKDNKLREIKKDILKPNSPNTRNILLNESAIIKLNYFCDNCIEGGIDIVQNMIIGKKFDFENKVLPSVEYLYDKLNFEANCSMNLNIFTQLKAVSFDDELIEVQALHGANDEAKGNFSLSNGVVKFKNTNPNGIIKCTYIYPAGEFHTSQTYKSFKDEEMPSITYVYDKLFFKPNCSMSQGKSVTLKTVLFNNEKIEAAKLQGTGGNQKGNFKKDNKFVVFTGTNPNGALSCTYQLPYGEISKYQKYKSFKDQNIPPFTYPRGGLRLTPNCPMDQGDSVNLKTVSFDEERVEVSDLNSRSDKRKGNFKSDGKFVNFLGTNPKGKLSCVFKLSYGEVSTNQSYGYFSNINHPIIRYASDQLVIRPNCSMEPEKNVNLETILFNDESVEADYLQNTDNNPKGKCTCVYKLQFGEIKTFQEYQSIEDTTLPDVKYAYDQLNFNPNCSREENTYTQLKTIKLNDKTIEVEGLNDAELIQMGNLKPTKNLLLYTVQNPEGKFSCIYKVPIGEIEKSQNYKPISNETLPVVEYSYNDLGYNANCSRYLNSFTHLRGIQFKDDKTTVVSLQRSRVGALGRLKLEKDFVINTEKNPNGTLRCLYDVPIGEVLVIKEFRTFKTGDEENSSKKMGYVASIIFGYMIVISMMI